MDQQYQVEYNIKSLLAVPWEACPWPAVRLALLRIAIEGAELYAYTHGPYGDGTVEWVIWHRQARPDVEARFSPRQWAIKYGYFSADEEEPDGDEAS